MYKNEYFTVARIQGRGERRVLEGASRKLYWSQIVKGFECQVLQAVGSHRRAVRVRWTEVEVTEWETGIENVEG